MTSTEVLIIGGGIIGNAIAYHLALQQRKVLVVERAEIAVEPAASWASAGGVRRQGRHPAEAALAGEAIARWHSLERELDADMGYRQGGNLLVAENEADAERLAAHVARQQALGFADVRLLDARGVREVAPGLGAQVVAGSFSPADGQADPALSTRAFATAAQRHGATYWTGTTCQALVRAGERIGGAQTTRGEVSADAVVVAAGAWGNALLAPLGIHLPMQTLALQMVLTTPAPRPSLVPVVSALGRRLSLKQLSGGAFLLGGGWLGDLAPEPPGYRLRDEHVAGNWQTARGIFPAVGAQPVARAWCGLEAMSDDEIPFIGRVPGAAGLIVATGFSGHGFALAPAVGHAVADQLAGSATPELDGLEPGRITALRLPRA